MFARVRIVADQAVAAEERVAVDLLPTQEISAFVTPEAEPIFDLRAEERLRTGTAVRIVTLRALHGCSRSGVRGMHRPIEAEEALVARAAEFWLLESSPKFVRPVDALVARLADPKGDRAVVILSTEVGVTAAGYAGLARLP